MVEEDSNIDVWRTDKLDCTYDKPQESEQFRAATLEDVLAERDADNSDSEYDDHDLIYNDMEIFCHTIDEPQLVEYFLKNKVTLGQLLEFDENDLINCGIENVGDRKKILSSIAQIHCEDWSPTSLQDLTAKTLLSSPGIYITINDINKHLEYIGITLRYLRRQLEHKPKILELGKDYVGVAKISSELKDLLKTSRTTYSHIQALNQYIDQHQDDPVLQPANHIDENYIRGYTTKRKIVFKFILVSFIICGCFKIVRVIL